MKKDLKMTLKIAFSLMLSGKTIYTPDGKKYEVNGWYVGLLSIVEIIVILVSIGIGAILSDPDDSLALMLIFAFIIYFLFNMILAYMAPMKYIKEE